MIEHSHNGKDNRSEEILERKRNNGDGDRGSSRKLDLIYPKNMHGQVIVL